MPSPVCEERDGVRTLRRKREQKWHREHVSAFRGAGGSCQSPMTWDIYVHYIAGVVKIGFSAAQARRRRKRAARRTAIAS